MSDLRDLYQDMILDHGRNPRNFRETPDANHVCDGHNPLCGDRVKLFVKVRDGVVEDISFQGSGCAISTASASLMTSAVKGKPIEEVRELFDDFHELITGDPEQESDTSKLGKLAVFSGVCEFPTRVKCATLSWHTLKNAIDNDDKPASTE